MPEMVGNQMYFLIMNHNITGICPEVELLDHMEIQQALTEHLPCCQLGLGLRWEGGGASDILTM